MNYSVRRTNREETTQDVLEETWPQVPPGRVSMFCSSDVLFTASKRADVRMDHTTHFGMGLRGRFLKEELQESYPEHADYIEELMMGD